MSAIVALFNDLTKGALLIKAEDALNYVVFRKYDRLGALHPKSGQYISFSEKQPVVAVTETTFDKLLLNHQFVFALAATKPYGFEAPGDIYVKTETSKISYLGENGPVGQFDIFPGSTKVIDLARTFIVKMRPVAIQDIH